MSTSVAAPAPRQMSSAARIAGVFFSPAQTFEDIAREPHFLLCWAVQIAAGIAFAYYVLHRLGVVVMARQALLASSRGRALDPVQLEAAVQQNAKYFQYGFYAAPVFVILGALFIAVIMLGVSQFILGQESKFKQVLALTSHAYLPQTLFSLATILVFVLAADPTVILFANPLGSNPGFFLDAATTSPFLLSLATHLDLFALWIVFLLALGLSKLGRKTKFSSAFFAVLLLWLVFCLVAAGAAAL